MSRRRLNALYRKDPWDTTFSLCGDRGYAIPSTERMEFTPNKPSGPFEHEFGRYEIEAQWPDTVVLTARTACNVRTDKLVEFRIGVRMERTRVFRSKQDDLGSPDCSCDVHRGAVISHQNIQAADDTGQFFKFESAREIDHVVPHGALDPFRNGFLSRTAQQDNRGPLLLDETLCHDNKVRRIPPAVSPIAPWVHSDNRRSGIQKGTTAFLCSNAPEHLDATVISHAPGQASNLQHHVCNVSSR